MVLEDFARLISDKEQKPNKFTLAMGKLIQAAREESGLSQSELAEKVYRRRATISDIETGKADVDTILLALLAFTLDKPIIYFFPDFAIRELKQEKLSALETEMLHQFNIIEDKDLKIAAIKQVTDLADLFK